MKTMRTLMAALFIAGAFVSPQMSGAETAKKTISFNMVSTKVTVAQVTSYLQGLGKTVLTTPCLQSDGFTYVCNTSDEFGYYQTFVYCNATSIVGYDDISL